MFTKTTSAALLALSLTGCFTGQEITRLEQRPKPQVELATFARVLPASSQATMVAETDGFLRAFRARYGDVIFIEGGATDRRQELTSYLRRAHPALRVVPREGATPKPLTLVLERAVTFTRGCEYFSRPVVDGADQAPLPGFGCASDTSLAQMVADPRDLLSGKPGGAIDAETPTDVIQAVREERFSITLQENTTTGTSEN